MHGKKVLYIMIGSVAASLITLLFQEKSTEIYHIYKEKKASPITTTSTGVTTTTKTTKATSTQAKPTRKSIMLSRNQLANIEKNRNRTKEDFLWSSLHKHQTHNTGFIHLYQEFVTGGPYGDKRHQEIRETIQYNIDHIHVRYLYIVEQTGNEKHIYKKYIKDPLGKVKFIPFGRQSNYSDVFAHLMNHIYPHLQKDEVWLMANSDIALGEGFDMIKGCIDSNTILLISRHDRFCSELNQCFHSRGLSTDIILGTSKVSEETYKHLNFTLYTRGGENEIMKYLTKAGFTLLNPCIDIKSYHNHCSGDRSWGKERRRWKPINRGDTYTYPIRWIDYEKQVMRES